MKYFLLASHFFQQKPEATSGPDALENKERLRNKNPSTLGDGGIKWLDQDIKLTLIRSLLHRQHIKKQRHYFANKGPSGQGYGFSSSHVWM